MKEKEDDMVKEEVRSILVIRSAPLPRTFEAVKKLQDYPKSSPLGREERACPVLDTGVRGR
jgi:hypothetical protein